MNREITDDDRLEVLPILPSLNIVETRDFYRDYLGFDTVGYEAEDYLILWYVRRPPDGTAFLARR